MKLKLAASLALAAILSLSGFASAALVITTENTNSASAFTPVWPVAADSLIAGLTPSSSGNFQLEVAGGLPKLNDASIGPVGSSKDPFATAGNNGSAGHEVVYTLPTSASGYDVTNITVYSGWGDNGRDAQGFYVLYATKANPTTFLPLGYVSYNPAVGGGRPSANRSVFADPTGVAIASNVAALKFDFSVPGVENGYVGYSEITVQGTPSTSETAAPIAMTMANENSPDPFVPTWPIETVNLITGQLPSRISVGGSYANEAGVTGLSAMTDGTFGAVDSKASYATCGGVYTAGNFVIYTLGNSPNGADLTNIVVYSGWVSAGRDGQYYKVSYSTVSSPTTFVPVTSVFYNPYSASGNSASRVAITTSTGTPLATNVYSVKFDFSPQTGGLDNGYSGYAEIVLQGRDSVPSSAPLAPSLEEDILPTYAETVVGDQVVFKAAFSNSPPANLQWELLSNGTTNALPGATGPVLTLNNVQLASAGLYRLKAVNATNILGVAYSATSPLIVSNLPAAAGGVIVAWAGQNGQSYAGTSTEFYPSWTIDSANSLIYQSTIGVSLFPGLGNFGLDQTSGDPTILTDGSFGYFNHGPGVGGSPTLVTCGVNPGGMSVTYVLPQTSSTGYDLTNIVVYGGWGDAGRNQQKYQVLYSTIATPNMFNNLVAVDYNPANPNNSQSATRTTIIPVGPALAANVYAVQFNFNLQGSAPKNGYEGYSEIQISGVPSAPKPVLTQDITPLSASDVEGSQLVIKAGFSGATGYQWQKDGVDLSGEITDTLILNNLQTSHTATNAGYTLVARNASGFAVSRPCAVTVEAKPGPVSNVVTAFAYQTADQASFSPTWDTAPLTSSLIYQTFPTENGTGAFDAEGSGGLPVLTDANYGMMAIDATHPAFAVGGPNAGQYVVYTLPPSPNGYDLTNIAIASGWNDGGRDAQFFTVGVSTPNNPATFIPVAAVANEPVLKNPSNSSVIRSTFTPATGVLARNVHAIQVDFTTPPGVPNGYSGYSEISVFGTPSTAVPSGPLVSGMSENTGDPSWVIETQNLIAGTMPSSFGTGSFAGGFNGDPVAGGLPVLTDGTYGPVGSGILNFATCGGAFGAGSSVTYTATGGWHLTNIVVYSGWGNYNRDGQFYTIHYTTQSDPSTQTLLATVGYNPPALSGPAAARVAIAPLNGVLATDVRTITFDFSVQGATRDNGYSGYAEIVLQGTNMPLTMLIPPVLNAPSISGGQLVMTGTGGTPNAPYTWLTTTNLTAPIVWTTNSNGTLDSNGSLSSSIPVDVSSPALFFQLRLP